MLNECKIFGWKPEGKKLIWRPGVIFCLHFDGVVLFSGLRRYQRFVGK